MTEQTSTATCKYPGCEAIPERAARPGAAGGVLRRTWAQQGDRVARAEAAR